MPRPRLIVLDAPHSSPPEELLAQRVARGLRQKQPPLVLVPIKNRMAGMMGTHGMQPTHLEADKPKWADAAEQAETALKQGRDVVIMGPVVTGPGTDWAQKIADAGSATLIGVRTLNRLAEGKPTDPRPDHDWMYRHFRSKDAAGAGARRIIAEAERIVPGPLCPQPAGSATPVLLVEQHDDQKRKALGQHLRREADAVVMDVDARRQAVSDSPDFQKLSAGPSRDQQVDAMMWAQLEADGQKALRSGKPVVVTGKHLSSKTSIGIAELLANLVGTPPKQVRILPRDKSTADRGDGFSNYGWPETRNTDQAARELSQYLLASDDEPGLQDLLDMPELFEDTPPKADRRRVETLPLSRP
ncbi:MAG: hypothetical protein Alpg2KO_05860 [Alphaproteobacteria bacterium]